MDSVPPDSPAPVARVCVIGTSNSIANGGWARVIDRAPEFRATNHSIGFCSSDLFAFRKPGIDFAQYDLGLLDFACNDGTLLRGAAMMRNQIDGAMSDAVSTMTRQGCLPVVMILPVDNFRPDKGHQIRIVYTEVARRYALPFFDGYAFLERLLAPGSPLAEVPLFKDNMHMLNDVSVELGEMLRELLPGIMAQRGPAEAQAVDGWDYAFLPAAEAIARPFDKTQRTTALVSAEVLQVERETCCDIRVAPHWEMTAAVIDFAHSHAVATLSGTRSYRLHVAPTYASEDAQKLVLGIWPLPRTIPSFAGTIRLALNRSPHFDATTDAKFQPPDAKAEPSLGLVGVVARRQNKELPVQRFLPKMIDLVAGVPEERFAAARDRLAARLKK
jgi:hypothetical protein